MSLAVTTRRNFAALAASTMAVTLLLAGTPAQAAETGPSIKATISRVQEKPSYYRTVDGIREPVYELAEGDTIHVRARMANNGSDSYWAMRMDFVTIGDDIFDTPDVPAYIEGPTTNWGTQFGARYIGQQGPYVRRTMVVYKDVAPGESSLLSYPITVDSLPVKGKLYKARFENKSSVSDPSLKSTATSERIWIVRK
ncbi:hypothetical protein EDF38_0155 [Frigoribacterium sp. PhB160]|uniref:hypothetical protein n=1 Tax=Frigoribacterium sp. PhB160 TaxID=2485192 RepID=UPI000F48B431|nr:hypothetical protein [Frigoribacterium sp. PhB160]ROS61076.1 hypothetical protein EDF38_0155 [Frigoribacterium sp. PhB160]